MLSSGVVLSALLVTVSSYLFERNDVVGSIKPPTHTHFGVWKRPIYCDYGTFVESMTLENEPSQGRGDDTAVNRIQLLCK